MIVLASIAITNGHSRGHPPAARISGLPNLFGVCVYSFMCHHSLPSLVTPINRKRKIYWLVFSDYLLILVFYLLLSFTGATAFEKLEDIYTLNFQKDKCATDEDTSVVPTVAFLQYFLPLFPVFTLSASFPIISITLTNNIKSLALPYIVERRRSASVTSVQDQSSFFVDRLLFPIIAVVPPVILTLFTENLQVLVGITGSYAGTSIQYVIPALLVYYARKASPRDDEATIAGEGQKIRRSFESPFARSSWVLFVMIWASICIVLVTVDHILE